MQADDTKAILGWSLYDWANSAFATTVMAGMFPVFFKEFWCAGIDQTLSTARLGVANSVGGVLVAVMAPLLGAIADKGESRKKFLMFFMVVGVLATSGMYMISKGSWLIAAVYYVLGVIGFSGGNIFYDSLIKVVASEKKVDFVSSLGFSLGYLGGGLLLALNVWMTLSPSVFGFSDTGEAVRFSFLSVGLWWAVFSVPAFLFIHESEGDRTVSWRDATLRGVRQLGQTIQHARHLRGVFLFLVAYWLYIDGVDTIIRMAVAYGISIGFSSKDLISALLLVQFVGFPAALGFGWLAGRIGTKNSILTAVAIYLIISIWGAFMENRMEFYILAIIIGLVQGGVQALSRSFYARMIPVERTAEFFGFYNMLGKFAVVLGPVLMGGVGLFVRTIGYSSDVSSRISLASISALFLIGGILLYFVKEEKVSV
ncbi:MAG: MFS transporter [Deltaproteobacteria bacterium]|nr:MFS transporter [Deltaproteobacteria bacterium]